VVTRTEYFRRVRVHPDDWEGLTKVNDDVSPAHHRLGVRILLPGTGEVR
jgi:hypothetical protein